jgi:AraC-like DNA-binding protein
LRNSESRTTRAAGRGPGLNPRNLSARERGEHIRSLLMGPSPFHPLVLSIDYSSEAQPPATFVVRDYLVIAPTAGQARLGLGDEELALVLGQGVVVCPERPFTVQTTGLASALVWKVDRLTLERRARAITGRRFPDVVEFAPVLRLDEDKGAALFRSLAFVAEEMINHSGIAQSPHVQGEWEQLLIRVLLESHSFGRGDWSVEATSVAKVERYIEAHLGEEITIASMIEASGVNAHTLFSAFKRHRGRSPMRFLRDLRLRHVRSRLLAATPSERVTDVLTACGITQFGRFAVEYKRIYGESPSATLKRAALSPL